MRAGRAFAILVTVLWPACSQAAPLEAYGNLPSLENVAISPNGKELAYVTNIAGERAVLVASIDDHKLLGGLKAGNQKIRDVMWADDDHVLTTISTTRTALGVIAPRTEWSLTQCFSVSTGKQFLLMENAQGESMNVVAGLPQPRTVNGKTIVYVAGITFVNSRSVLGLFAIDLDRRAARLLHAGDPNTQGWIIDRDGNAVAETAYDESDQSWKIYVRDGGGKRQLYAETAPIETPEVEGIAPDGESLLVSMTDGHDRQLKLADGTWKDAVDLGGRYVRAIEDPASHRIIGAERLGVGTSYHFLDPADQAAWNEVANAYEGENVQLVSWSADRRRIVIRADGPRDGAAFQLVDLDAHSAITIGLVYKAIGPFDVADVKRIAYPAADGLQIPAYLTLPSGRPAKNLPLVVLPHGGPAVRDMPEFDWWSQALASRGYAVLQPEFRGSAGFGRKFLAAGFGEWGRKMQTDLSDGVRYLAKDGTIDPKRVCIVGGSYGGYAALAGVTLDRGVYRCAVAVAPVADPHEFLRWNEHREHHDDSQVLRYWNRFLGVADIDDPKLSEISPMAHAADADAPVLLIHGRDDTVVPIAQSEDMADALEHAHKTVKFITLDGEDHWLSRAETRLRMLTETVSFLEANNPPD